MFPQHQQASGEFAPAPTMDTALMAAQLQAARAQSEMDALAKKVRADRIALEQPWKDPRFFPIGADNVMFYFCQRDNPFFDPSSDNALILMQNQGIGPAQLDAVLKGMTGIQFVLLEPCSPPLFVIRKQQRMAPDKITPLCHYYVLDGTVYQAPDMHTLVHSRLIGIMDPLRCAFQETLDMLRFTPARGHYWEFRTRPARRAAESEETEESEEADSDNREAETQSNPLTARATPYQSRRTHALLQALMERFGGKNDGEAAERASADGSSNKMEMDSPAAGTSEEHAGTSTSTAALPSMLTDFQGLLFPASSSGANSADDGIIASSSHNHHHIG